LRYQAVTDAEQGVNLPASLSDKPCWSTPMAMPPTKLINKIKMPAMASPLTNLDAPSMAPKKSDSWDSSSRRFLCGGLVDHAGVQVSVDRHLFARHGIQGESGVHFRDAASTFGHHNEVDDHQDRKR
jgi:hypothetical protein